MMLDVTGVFGAAWRTWLRDRDVLLRVAGLFYFLPLLVIGVAVPDAPQVAISREMTEAERLAVVEQLSSWLAQSAHWYVLSAILVQFGSLTILTLYLGPQRLTVGEALRRALPLLPRYVLAMMLVGIPTTVGYVTMVLLLPALYLLGRLLLVAPTLVAEPPPGIGRSMTRSFQLTRGNGFALAGVATLVLLAGLLQLPFHALTDVMAEHHAANPLAVLIVEALAAAAGSVSLLAMPLLQVAIYRSLSARHGV
jgi:hypothetical protein